jgi:hypothetical protein
LRIGNSAVSSSNSASGTSGSPGGSTRNTGAALQTADSFSSTRVGTSSGGYTSFEGTSSITVPQMPSAKGLKLTDPNVMADYQEAMQHYTQMLQLKSQIQSMLHDTRKQMVQNMRA